MKTPPPQATPIERVFRVPVYFVREVDVLPLISTFGTARPDQEVTIAAEVAGRIVETSRLKVGVALRGPDSPPADAPTGTPTSTDITVTSTGGTTDEPAPTGRPGDLLVQIDPDTYHQRWLQAQAMLAQDAAELERLRQEVKNAQTLLEQRRQSLASAAEQLKIQERLTQQGAGRETDLRRTELELQQYEAGVLQLETELALEDSRRQQILARQAAHEKDLELARLELERSSVRAPFDGTISEVFVEQGQYLRVGEPLVKLTNTRRVEVALPLPVSRSGPLAELVAAGEQPRVQLAEHESADCRWVGRVTRIAPVADATTRTVDVFAEVDNSQLRDPLRPGTFVHARIESAEMKRLVLIPRDAVIDGAVFIAQADAPTSASVSDRNAAANAMTASAQRRPVQIAGFLQSFAIVSLGLSASERVILTNLDILKDGTRLSIVEERDVHSELQREKAPAFEVLRATPVAGLTPGADGTSDQAAR